MVNISQFARLQSFSRKPNPGGQCVAQVLAEAGRNPTYNQSVQDPQPPVLLDGSTLADPQAEHDAMVANACCPVSTDGISRFRTLRRDRHTLMTAIASSPLTLAETDKHPAKIEGVRLKQQMHPSARRRRL